MISDWYLLMEGDLDMRLQYLTSLPSISGILQPVQPVEC